MKDFVCVKTCGSRMEAAVATSMLETQGIQSFVTGDDEGGMLPFSLGKEGIQLWVAQKDEKKAKACLV